MDYTLPAAIGDTDGEPFVRALSKLFLLKERRERIISCLLNIRFAHNVCGVFTERAPFLLLIAAIVAAAFFLGGEADRGLVSLDFLKSKMFDVAMAADSFFFFCRRSLGKVSLMCCFPASVCCFSPH